MRLENEKELKVSKSKNEKLDKVNSQLNVQ